ncbi:sulfurtransferase TusA family protein [Desulfovibrio sp. OttesenSCG-928-C14]|nr:sulfurtransferase TusA family protein [Desulfovibrio sp. OttesenSCG-928-C14]
MKSINAKGLSCPQPMLLAKKAMEENQGGNIEIEVDCAASVENISRAAGKLGWEVKILSQAGDEAKLELSKK